MCCQIHKSAMSYMILLTAARAWCLQVKNQQGQWINADPIPGTFVCNIGDMLKVLDKLHVNRADLLGGFMQPVLRHLVCQYMSAYAFVACAGDWQSMQSRSYVCHCRSGRMASTIPHRTGLLMQIHPNLECPYHFFMSRAMRHTSSHQLSL